MVAGDYVSRGVFVQSQEREASEEVAVPVGYQQTLGCL